MSRQSRFEYFQSRLPLERRPTANEVAKLMALRVKQSLIRKGLIPDPSKQPPKKLFGWQYGDIGGNVPANTRSEARARIKAELGIKKGRLPAEVKIVEVVPEKLNTRGAQTVRGTGANEIYADQPAST